MLIGPLLSDAKAGEDLGEDVVGGDGAGDGAEVVEGAAEVLGDKVGRGAGAEAETDVAEGVSGLAEGIGVAGVDDEGARLGGEAGGLDYLK